MKLDYFSTLNFEAELYNHNPEADLYFEGNNIEFDNYHKTNDKQITFEEEPELDYDELERLQSFYEIEAFAEQSMLQQELANLRPKNLRQQHKQSRMTLGPVVKNGILVGYRVKPGQGFTQVAKDINSPFTQKEYGYKLAREIEWEEIVSHPENRKYTEGAKFKNGYLNKWDKAHCKLNMNVRDYLAIPQTNIGFRKIENENIVFIDPNRNKHIIEAEEYLRQDFAPMLTEPIREIPMGMASSGGGFYLGYGWTRLTFKPDKDSIGGYWEDWLDVDLNGMQFGTAGIELLSASAGSFSFEKSFFDNYKSNSLTSMLSYTDHIDSYTAQYAFRYNYLAGYMYDDFGERKKIWSMHLYGFGLGVGVSISTGEGKVDWSLRNKMDKKDSINRSIKLKKKFGGEFSDY